ncbi:MAG: RagB/SusD family nutrient uptake outer membrane protein [Tannerella sp.]|jgi:muconolactone delta-isomerase|nr:RagB/SusD family nutrient uptake outer membrane protein [Tannerella sp.]
MKNYIVNKIVLFAAGTMLFSSCDDLFTPAIENFKDEEQMYEDASYAQGFLVNVYRCIPGYYDNSEYATDDAVTNQKTHAFLTMATGSWTASSYSPLNQWTNSYSSIQYINLFLENADKVNWAEDEEVAALFKRRMKGEAYGMRALFLYSLLRAHAGVAENGQLLGVPILTEYQDALADFNQPRNTFEECVRQIYADLDLAEQYLPVEYEDVTAVPSNFSETAEAYKYNRVMGQVSRQLFNGLIAKAYRAKTALLAASPAFQDATNTTTWTNAADAAATLIDYKGGVAGLASGGWTYYCNTTEINGLGEGINPPEMIWRMNIAASDNDQEAKNYPPSIFGTGYMNPTQNLIDAFPMRNGYPISADPAISGYDPENPYAMRDPRLAQYIIYNGSTGVGSGSATIYTGSGLGTDDGINIKETSTRTGYYMKKRLRMDINCNPSSTTKQAHYIPRIRYTEMYLNYAEAANEAWGPKGTGSHSYSAYDVIKAIRQRAGVGGTNDEYLEFCAANKDEMRKLIRNERRLELCFESFRFWDLRRWKENLNETAKGINWKADGTYEVFDVEQRTFRDYMIYPPIPYSETLKYSNLLQNKGWN